MIPEKRSLSGIFIRFKNPETGEIENRTFEDLPEEEQDKWMEKLPVDALQRLSKTLADSLREIGDGLGLSREPEE